MKFVFEFFFFVFFFLSHPGYAFFFSPFVLLSILFFSHTRTYSHVFHTVVSGVIVLFVFVFMLPTSPFFSFSCFCFRRCVCVCVCFVYHTLLCLFVYVCVRLVSLWVWVITFFKYIMSRDLITHTIFFPGIWMAASSTIV